MPTILLATDIAAPARRCFDLARSIDAHVHFAAYTHERAIAGRTTGLLDPGETVTWQARHLGLTFRLTSQLTAFDPPHYFQDRMTRGPFRHFEHDHHFHPTPAGHTRMTDALRFSSPLGPLGHLANLLLTRHLRRFLYHRALALKSVAESDEWSRFLQPDKK
jgi:ligand-binding SRPBCC domain-containing protein